jgi:4,5-DOPA dioxygenase extradiol
MPVLFSAHGNPVNAIDDNAFTRFLRGWASTLPAPRAILAVSAHWAAPEVSATTSLTPPTIHDFSGFPRPLYALRYPVLGDPALAARAVDLLRVWGIPARLEGRRGLDHGVWSPLIHIWPDASIPSVQMSLLQGAAMARHVEVGRALAPLREEGVLILGSGNIVHNLATAELGDRDLPVQPWAAEFDAWVAAKLEAHDLEALASFSDAAPHGHMAHPTPEHFLPVLVAAGAAEDSRVSFPYTGFEHGTLSRRCVRFD